MSHLQSIEVDIIIPVHNAASVLKEAVLSALHQEIPTPTSSSPNSPSSVLNKFLEEYSISVTVCCYNDGSSDESLEILRQIESSESNLEKRETARTGSNTGRIPSRLLVKSSEDGRARGAGYARNRAIEMTNPSLGYNEISDVTVGSNSTTTEKIIKSNSLKFLCLLDSDDVMEKHRVIEQTLFMIYEVDVEDWNRTIVGSTFDRDPPDSTWHYSNWANNLSDERLMLERYREMTILHPTWFMSLAVWEAVGGYVEAPSIESSEAVLEVQRSFKSSSSSLAALNKSCLVHPKYDTPSSLKLAEDLRFFHSHLQLGGKLRLHRTALATTSGAALPLVTYRHTGDNASQSFRTSRKLLLQLRALAFQTNIIRANPLWHKFVIWGCGRDGKDFFKALDQDVQSRVYCFVDVDTKKLNAGYYVVETVSHTSINKKTRRESGRKIPIVHFSFLIPDEKERCGVQSEWMSTCAAGKDSIMGQIDKSKPGSDPKQPRPKKKQKKASGTSPNNTLQHRGLDQMTLLRLPIVVCVAMYRTNGVLEDNVAKIGRTEGNDLWHFS